MENLVKKFLDRLDPDERKKLKDLLSEKSKGLDRLFNVVLLDTCPDDFRLNFFEVSVVESCQCLNIIIF